MSTQYSIEICEGQLFLYLTSDPSAAPINIIPLSQIQGGFEDFELKKVEMLPGKIIMLLSSAKRLENFADHYVFLAQLDIDRLVNPFAKE